MHQHYIEDKDSFVPVEDVVETFRKHFGQQKDVAILIGRLVSSTFKGVKKERIRQKGNWSQRLHVYKGMATRSCVLIPANLQSISKYIPEDFFPNTEFIHLSCLWKRHLADLQWFQSLDGGDDP